ncbi:MAG: TolC family protein [Acidobacteriota bacterium]|nr:TolC family protein [Acidobacteriota bacterium]
MARRARRAALPLQVLSVIAAALIASGAARAQQPSPAAQTQSPAPTQTQSPSPSQTPATTQAPPSSTTPQSTQSATPPGPTPAQTAEPLALEQVLGLANAQVSALRQAQLNERIAAEDVRQARAAFLPKVTSPLDYIYTSPSVGLRPGEPRTQSFIANNAIGEYQALLSVGGDVDISGRLRATLARANALLDAARAGTEVARAALRQTTVEAYYGLSLAEAARRSAEQNLAAAQQFELITSLLLKGGEVAPVDLTRAELQTNQRQNELEQARANESVAADALRVLVGYGAARAVSTTDLSTLVPADGDVERFTAEMIQRRPELAQFEAERRAAQQDILVARAERLPQLSYTLNGGFDTDSVKLPRLKEHTGVSAAVHVVVPIFDWGATRSRERQAQARLQIAENERATSLRAFAQQFSSARTQALSAAARIRLAAAGLRLAQSNLNASIARYRAGEAQIVEVTDAQTSLAAQRLAYFQAIFDYQIALARLRQAAGQ